MEIHEKTIKIRVKSSAKDFFVLPGCPQTANYLMKHKDKTENRAGKVTVLDEYTILLYKISHRRNRPERSHLEYNV